MPQITPHQEKNRKKIVLEVQKKRRPEGKQCLLLGLIDL